MKRLVLPFVALAVVIGLTIPVCGWGWKLATDPDDVINFLNGADPYGEPVADVQICAYWNGSYASFIVFYESAEPSQASGGWGWKLATDPDDVMDFLNGTDPYGEPLANAQVCAYWNGTYASFVVFYGSGEPGAALGGWGWKLASDVDDALNFVNGTGGYTRPVSNFLICSVWRGYEVFYVFYQR